MGGGYLLPFATLICSTLSQMTVGGNTLYFAYDASGTPMSVTYNGATYCYATNLQGDVTAILSTIGTAVVQYTYDAWGKLLTTTGSMASALGAHNPLRYRGYVYDPETGLYYLQTRYFDPEMGRFLNTDAYASTGQGLVGNNMFAYCQNNPIIYADYEGKFLCTAIGAIAGAISGAIWGLIEGKSGVELEASIMSGAASGAVTGLAGDILLLTGGTATVAAVAMAAAGAAGSAVGNLVEESVTGKDKTFVDYVTDAAWGAGFGALGGYMGGSIPSQTKKIAEYGFAYVADRVITQESTSFYADIGKELVSNYTSSVLFSMAELYLQMNELYPQLTIY